MMVGSNSIGREHVMGNNGCGMMNENEIGLQISASSIIASL